MKLFTKRFFQLDSYDQSAVLQSVIHDLESCMGRHRDSKDDRKAERKIALLRRRANDYGLRIDRASPRRKGDLPGQMVMWEE